MGLLHLVLANQARPADGWPATLNHCGPPSPAPAGCNGRELGGRSEPWFKRIPVGAGLAGGSSDAAATLLGLNRYGNLALGLATTCRHLARNSAPMWPSVCLRTQLCFGAGASTGALRSAEPAQPPLCQLRALLTGVVLLIKDPTASVSTPWAYGRLPANLRGDFYAGARSWNFEERPPEACARVALLAAPGRERPLPPLRNDRSRWWKPEQASVRQGLGPAAARPDGALGVAMSGSGPVSLALFADPAAAEAARPSWPEHSQAPRGSKAGGCRCSSMGVRLDRDAADDCSDHSPSPA